MLSVTQSRWTVRCWWVVGGWWTRWGEGGGDWGKPAGCKRSHEMGLTGEFCPLSGVVCPEMKLIGKPVVWKMGWTRSHLVFRSGLRVCHSVPPRSCPRNDLNYPSLSLSPTPSPRHYRPFHHYCGSQCCYYCFMCSLLACRLAGTDCKNRLLPNVFILV